MSFSAFDHPVLGGLLGDDELATLFSFDAELASMLRFEIALALAEAELGIIPARSAAAIETALQAFKPDIDKLRDKIAVDGVIVPEFVRQMRTAVDGDAAKHLHFGATSQDVIDSALMLRTEEALALLETRLLRLVPRLDALAARDGGNVLMGRARMQAGLPITASDRIGAWVEPIRRNAQRIQALLATGFPIQFGGAVGTLDVLGTRGPRVRKRLAEKLRLRDAPQWHSQRDMVSDIANLLSLISGANGKLGQDIALMAQAGDEIVLGGGGGSSAMPHKRNPVSAEVLVALARFNATQLSGMHYALVHEQERSGAAWTLEWMLLPQMICAAGASLRHALLLVESIESIGLASP